jgi:transcription elongation factor GreB
MPGIRYREPGPASSALITRSGYERLSDELDQLWNHERPPVVTALAAAAAEGDRSENAEYLYRKKQLAGIDRRVRYLSKLLKRVQIVEAAPADPSRIYFGAWVTVEDQTDGSEHHYRIVGPDETDAAQSWISVDSPLARALLQKRLDDEVAVQTPIGVRQLMVLDIRY